MAKRPHYLKDLDCWPPALTDTRTFRVVPASSTGPARFKRCGVLAIVGSPLPYLSIVVDFQGRDWHAVIQDIPEPLMHRIAATLKGHEDEPLEQLGDLAIVGGATS